MQYGVPASSDDDSDDRLLLFVIEGNHVLLESAIDALSHFGHTILLDQRKNSRFDRCDAGMELHHHASLHLALLVWSLIFVIGFAQKCQRAAISTGTWFDNVGVKRSLVSSSR